MLGTEITEVWGVFAEILMNVRMAIILVTNAAEYVRTQLDHIPVRVILPSLGTIMSTAMAEFA
jgi:hypothetical protein